MRHPTQVLTSLIGVLVLCVVGTALAKGDDRPKVVSAAPADVTSTGALLQGNVNPNDHKALYRFEYGTSTSYGATSLWKPLPDSKEWFLVSEAVSGLEPGTTYNYRVVATNEKKDPDKTTYGPDRSFTTPAAPVAGEEPPAVDPAPAPTPVGPVAPVETSPGPALGSSVGLDARGGTVTVRRPGTRAPVVLTAGSVVPMNSVIDATAGTVALTSVLPSGKTQTGRFRGGAFQVRQAKKGYIDLYLRGKSCPRHTKARTANASVTATASRRKGRRLFGSDHGGRFRTHGRHSQATVRGTRWMVEDRCEGTLTRVSEGAVVVKDFGKSKRVLVKAGHSYLARPRH
jgi:hypothetical protein